MTGNISYLSDFEPFDGGYVSFGHGGCRITGKGTIKTDKLEFENVYFVKDLKYNLFSVSQICYNKNSVLFTDAECIVLERNFKLLDGANILLRTPRQHNMYSIDLNNIVSHKDLTCLVAKASDDECILWHRRLGLRLRLVTFLRSSKRVANQEETPSLDNIPSLTNRFEDILGVTTSSDETIVVEADVSNMETSISASPTPTLRIHKDHPKSQIIGLVDTPIQTRHKSKMMEDQSFIATIHQKTDPALLQFLEPKKVSDALQDPSWVEAMQEELLQSKIQKVWTLVDCPKG
nr:ribonuclease H-like domain-containing protein [Tanacetum cinerariifolium]